MIIFKTVNYLVLLLIFIAIEKYAFKKITIYTGGTGQGN